MGVNPYRSAPVTIDRETITRAIEVLQEAGSMNGTRRPDGTSWWDELYDVRDLLCTALGEPLIKRPR